MVTAIVPKGTGRKCGASICNDAPRVSENC